MNENLPIFRILRFITPDEIEEMTSSSSGGAQVSLTSIALKRIASFDEEDKEEDDGGAKILPFTTGAKKERHQRDSIDEEIESFEKRTVEADKRREDAKRLATERNVHFSSGGVAFEEEEVVDEKLDTSVFILAEQRKLKKSQEKLKVKEVIGLYQKNAAVSVEQEKKINEDMSKSTYSGVLINRRRF